MTAGIVSYGSYVPYFQLQRSAIAEALERASGKGARSVASYDEDTTTMGVEAGRLALANAPLGTVPVALYFATTAPAYLDKTNASALHAALNLDETVGSYDFVGSVRSSAGALRVAVASAVTGQPSVLVVSDLRTGLPGSVDETEGGDGAAAFVFADSADVLAYVIGWSSMTHEFLDRWRLPGERSSHLWEERFGENAYLPIAAGALTDGLKASGIAPEEIDHLIVVGPQRRAAARVSEAIPTRAEAKGVDIVTPAVGNAGAAQGGLALAAALDRARPNEVIVMITVADGADVVVLRTTDALMSYADRRLTTVADQLSRAHGELSYTKFISWRGELDREPPRRPDPDRPAAPPSSRREAWKFGFVASRCTECGTRHLPPARVCMHCHAVDQMAPEPLADIKGTVVTFTVDRLTYSPSPPAVGAVIDFDEGGRLQCELTDVDPAEVEVGMRVEMTFRRLSTAATVHNYFWKARPVRSNRGHT